MDRVPRSGTSKRAVAFDSTVIQAGLTTPEIQGELMLLAWTGSILQVLMP